MMQIESFLKHLESCELCRIGNDGVQQIGLDRPLIYVAINPSAMELAVASNDTAAQLIVLRSGELDGLQSQQPLKIDVAKGGRVNVVELLFDGAQSDMVISQGDDSHTCVTLVELANSDAKYTVNLDGCGADTQVDMLQLLSDKERAQIALRIAHNSSDCTSNSTSKCVANGNSVGEFRGMVYVAQDAQRTVAHQNSRNVAMCNDARIVAEPQLEIYADDVMCSHGATVGQMNQEAIYYMRQRGLSEAQARKMQLEGFVADISDRCCIEQLRAVIADLLGERLEQL